MVCVCTYMHLFLCVWVCFCCGRCVKVGGRPQLLVLTLHLACCFLCLCVHPASWPVSLWGLYCLCLPAPWKSAGITDACPIYMSGCFFDHNLGINHQLCFIHWDPLVFRGSIDKLKEFHTSLGHSLMCVPVYRSYRTSLDAIQLH